MEVEHTGLCRCLQEDVFLCVSEQRGAFLLALMQKPLRSGLRQTSVHSSLFFSNMFEVDTRSVPAVDRGGQ